MKQVVTLVLLIIASISANINGFFIQPSLGYGAPGWNRDGKMLFSSQDDFNNWIESMHKIGASHLIYQWSSRYEHDAAWFSSSWGGSPNGDFCYYENPTETIMGISPQSWTSPTTWPGTDRSPLLRTLDAAEKFGVKVWIGLYLNEHYDSYNWWSVVNKNGLSDIDSLTISYHTLRSQAIIIDLANEFGSHPAFHGVYFTPEVPNLGFMDIEDMPLLNLMLFDISQTIDSLLPGKRFAISPFFNINLTTPEEVGELWREVLPGSGIDLLILQDGLGVEPHLYNEDYYMINSFIREIREATLESGVSFWMNVENFTNIGNREEPHFIPTDIENLSKQINLANKWSDTIISFAFNYMDPNPDHQLINESSDPELRLKLYNNYKDLSNTQIIDIKQPNVPIFNIDGSIIESKNDRPISIKLYSVDGREINSFYLSKGIIVDMNNHASAGVTLIKWCNGINSGVIKVIPRK